MRPAVIAEADRSAYGRRQAISTVDPEHTFRGPSISHGVLLIQLSVRVGIRSWYTHAWRMNTRNAQRWDAERLKLYALVNGSDHDQRSNRGYPDVVLTKVAGPGVSLHVSDRLRAALELYRAVVTTSRPLA